MKDIVVLGSGGFAKEVVFLIKEINRIHTEYNFIGYVGNDHESYISENITIYSDGWLIERKNPLNVAVGIGNPQIVKKLIEKLSENPALNFPNLIHPNVIGDWSHILMGVGNIICAGNIFTTDIKIGSFNIFNLSCTLGHDAVIENHNVFNPTVNLSGGICIGSGNLIGTGSKVLQNLHMGSDIIIGAGAVVTKNLSEPGTYVGIPAKKI